MSPAQRESAQRESAQRESAQRQSAQRESAPSDFSAKGLIAALCDGEDFELCFTLAASEGQKAPSPRVTPQSDTYYKNRDDRRKN